MKEIVAPSSFSFRLRCGNCSIVYRIYIYIYIYKSSHLSPVVFYQREKFPSTRRMDYCCWCSLRLCPAASVSVRALSLSLVCSRRVNVGGQRAMYRSAGDRQDWPAQLLTTWLWLWSIYRKNDDIRWTDISFRYQSRCSETAPPDLLGRHLVVIQLGNDDGPTRHARSAIPRSKMGTNTTTGRSPCCIRRRETP